MIDRLDALFARAVAELPKSALIPESIPADVDPTAWVPESDQLVLLLEWTSHFLCESTNRHAYNSCELLAALLAHPADRVVMAALYALLQATRRNSLCGRHHRCASGVCGSPATQQRLWQMVQTRADINAAAPSLSFKVPPHIVPPRWGDHCGMAAGG